MLPFNRHRLSNLREITTIPATNTVDIQPVTHLQRVAVQGVQASILMCMTLMLEIMPE